MGEHTLLALARAVEQAHAQLAHEVRERSEQARHLADEVQTRLDTLIAALHAREGAVGKLHDAIADRMNNLLMAINTARDLLRATDEENIRRVREHLDATVDRGRQSVKHLAESLRPLR